MTDLILKYLARENEAKISGFGTFSQKESPAFYDEKSFAILPPAKQIFFEVNHELNDDNFTHFYAAQNNVSFSEAKLKIKEETDYWKFTLQNLNELEVLKLGHFMIYDNQVVFKGERFLTENPNNFGLEEVNLAKLDNNSLNNNLATKGNYKKSTNKLWWLFIIIPTSVIIYYATQNPELIFGKKSFENLNKIKTNSILKKDSLKNKTAKKDSISLKNTINAQK